MIESRKRRLSYNLKDIIEELTGEPIEKYSTRNPEKQHSKVIKQNTINNNTISAKTSIEVAPMKKTETNITSMDNEMLVSMIAALLAELLKRNVTGDIFKTFLFN